MIQKDNLNPPFHALRPGDDTVRQFTENRQGFLAVHTSRPYGDLTDTQAPGLMKSVEKGDDYTVFTLPKAAMALKALTLGTGHRRAELLSTAYQNVGHAVGRIVAEGVDAPELSIDDIAVNRRTGWVYMVPPIDFVASPESSSAMQSLTTSLGGLSSVFSPDNIQRLRNHLEEGFKS